MKVLLAAVLINALHAALEDREIALGAVRGHDSSGLVANVFVFAVVHAIVAREFLADFAILLRFVGLQTRFLGKVLADDRREVAGRDAIDMERANLLRVAIDKREDRILVSGAAASFRNASLAANECFINLDGAAFAAERNGKRATAERFADAMREEPSRLVLNLEHTMKLVGANALLRRSEEIDGLKHLVQRDMRRLKNSADLHSELLAAVRALAEAEAGLPKVVMLPRDGAAMRANRAVGPQDALEMRKGGGFVVEVGLRKNGHWTSSLIQKLHRPLWFVKCIIASILRR